VVLRSILWVGSPDPVAGRLVADAAACEVAWARSAEEALELPLAAFDAVLVEVARPDRPGRELAALAAARGRALLVAVVDPGGSHAAERLRAAGADAVAVRPAGGGIDLEPVLAELRGPAGSAPAPRGLVAESRAMRRTLALVERARASRVTVLLSGETGTGKEVLARALHEDSERDPGPFVAVNCAAFPDALLESELFGHLRGAFTGADRDKKGLFEAAHGGVLFLDEVGETSPTLQAKLLRALQEREVRAVGGTRSRRVDVRVVAATNRELSAEVRRGAFRADLYYRLAVFPIAVPPLRRRREDILPLARHFLRLHAEREERQPLLLSREAEELLVAHAWPGNVRELENEMQRVVALAEPGVPVPAALLSERLAGALEAAQAAKDGETLRESLDRVEAWLIRRCLERNGGRKSATARQLGVTREGLYKKMRRLGIGS
jgi:transcriptional regulator with PAS, ATPase and Fis domain